MTLALPLTQSHLSVILTIPDIFQFCGRLEDTTSKVVFMKGF